MTAPSTEPEPLEGRPAPVTDAAGGFGAARRGRVAGAGGFATEPATSEAPGEPAATDPTGRTGEPGDPGRAGLPPAADRPRHVIGRAIGVDRGNVLRQPGNLTDFLLRTPIHAR